jgi:putative endonuclease
MDTRLIRRGREYQIPVLTMHHYLYILQSTIKAKTYIGIATDLDRRLTEHNSGKTRSTKPFAPWKIIHQEKYDTRTEARKREKYLKSAAGRAWIPNQFYC